VSVCAAVALVTAAIAPDAAAQEGPARPTATALAVRDAPTIDGQLNERVWLEATPLARFTQAEPFQGQAASEPTEVRLLYDDNALYVGVTLHDSDPSQIVTTDTRRDANLNEMDSFQILLDTYSDRQNGFVFGTNALGTQYDAQVRNEGAPTRRGMRAGTCGRASPSRDGRRSSASRCARCGTVRRRRPGA
jgi:hypothetical protein